MSSRQQAKRQAFNAAQRRSRTLRRIERNNRSKPGFGGAVMRLVVQTDTGPVRLGPGALFFR